MWTCPNCKVELKAAGGHLKPCLNPYLDVESFRNLVQVGSEADCWPFMGARVPAGGYGRFTLNRRFMAAHRVAYMLAYGDIPAGLDIMHLCDNPPCCNPKHLRAATTAENMADMRRKGRHPKLLKREVVLEIRSLSGKLPPVHIARKFNINSTTVWKILRGLSYSEIA